VGLDFPGELWRPESELPGYATLIAEARRWGYRTPSGWELTHNLLPDVMDAALLVDYATEKLLDAVERAEREWAAFLNPIGPPPELGWGVSDIAIADAYWEFGTILAAIRSLGDRVDRRWSGERLGLLPALEPSSRLHDRVRALYDAFDNRLLSDARYLAAYALHESKIPYPFNTHASVERGRLELHIPNRAARAVRTPYGLRYSQRRTVRSFLAKNLPVIHGFVDDLLAAFEDEIPARVRR
jgi:hypothetical protein